MCSVPEVLGNGSRIGDSEEEILEIRERGGLVPILVNCRIKTSLSSSKLLTLVNLEFIAPSLQHPSLPQIRSRSKPRPKLKLLDSVGECMQSMDFVGSETMMLLRPSPGNRCDTNTQSSKIFDLCTYLHSTLLLPNTSSNNEHDVCSLCQWQHAASWLGRPYYIYEMRRQNYLKSAQSIRVAV